MFKSFIIVTSHQIIFEGRLRWARHVACMGRRGVHGVFWREICMTEIA
jgi:hypothetical protein